ncbi:hypothetical protein CMV_000069 [Castanea mollissima]|uniref:Uncharacterized protein n=1 Tax=Castanea mollissima TaxID=60419 RepID=A0A8J4W7N2_9ROSI|nr:hypothetical protein CMV_000069 [Castanea mollissima]
MEGISQDDPPIIEQTQRANKRPIQEASGKGKEVAKKGDKASEMTTTLQEHIALARESDLFWQYDFDDAYFNSNDDDIDIRGCDFDNKCMNLDNDMHYGSDINYD